MWLEIPNSFSLINLALAESIDIEEGEEADGVVIAINHQNDEYSHDIECRDTEEAEWLFADIKNALTLGHRMYDLDARLEFYREPSETPPSH